MVTDLQPNLAGTALRAARQRKGRSYTFRRVEELTALLEVEDPQRYEKLSKSQLWEIETYGEAFIGRRAVSPGKIRALIKVLYNGDYQAFTQETGLSVPVLEFDSEQASESIVEIPLYLEGERSTMTRLARPLIATSDFLFEARSSRMEPLLSPGQAVHCGLTDSPVTGELAVIETLDSGLQVACWLGNGRYGFTRTGAVGQMRDGESVLGVVQWLRPMVDPTQFE